jgi:uncharacterized protein YndB with AHSA1/START domain
LPPANIRGEMLSFDFREGGSYGMRLTYFDPGQEQGKTAEAFDEFEVRLTKLDEGRQIEQEVTFESDDPAFAGVMRMTWLFEPENGATLVRIRAENVPDGIRPEDHHAGMSSSLENLAQFVEGAS